MNTLKYEKAMNNFVLNCDALKKGNRHNYHPSMLERKKQNLVQEQNGKDISHLLGRCLQDSLLNDGN
jgi:hypothetical protein